MTDHKQREALFASAFGQANSAPAPTPHLGQTWRFDMNKVGQLPFDEKYNLSNFEGVAYRDLPAWIRDGGYVIASAEEKGYQKKALAETGLSQTERNLVFDQAQADMEALAAMTSNAVLRDTAVLDGEIKSLQARYGSEFESMLQQADPEAATYVNTRQKTQVLEAKVAAQSVDEAAVRAEIQAAQEAIAAMGGNPLIADSVQRGSEVD